MPQGSTQPRNKIEHSSRQKWPPSLLKRRLGTTMIEWSHKKATMIDGSRMHFACYSFDNYLVHKIFISKISRESFQIKKCNQYIVYIKKYAGFNLFYGLTTIIGLTYLSSKLNFSIFF